MNMFQIPPSLMKAEIDLQALAHNFQELRRVASAEADIMAVVKADGYGHGSVKVSEVALANGAERLAVARFNEVVQLRNSGITAPVLLFGYCVPDAVDYLIENDTRASVGSLDSAQILSEEAGRLGKKLKVHIKTDTGMGRLGIMSDRLLADIDLDQQRQAIQTILNIARLPHLEIEGIYTHFACADSADKQSVHRQFELFAELIKQLKQQGLEFPLCHAANSAAVVEFPESHLNMVRPGIAQYGLWPSPEVNRSLIDLQPALTLKSHVIQVKEVPAGFKISYGSTYETTAPTRIATVPVGYADGYSRSLSSRGSMLVGGVKVPIVGRVCMDLTMIDVGAVEGVSVGDEVVLLGKQGNSEISADEIADLLQTINYEVVSSITARVEKQYINETKK